MNKTVKFLLRNTYASVNRFKLESTGLNHPLFVRGIDLPRYIKENNHKMISNYVISIVDPNLNNIYWDNREQLSITDLDNLNDHMKEPIIEFNRVDDDDAMLQKIAYYQLNNNNIDYNVLYVSVKDFVEAINHNEPIKIKLSKIDMNVEYSYELYDLYNRSTQKIDNVISR